MDDSASISAIASFKASARGAAPRGGRARAAVARHFLAEERWGAISLSPAGDVWAAGVALAAPIVTLIAFNFRHLPALRASMDAGADAAVLPAISVASSWASAG